MRNGRFTYGVIVAGAGAWCALILLAPALSRIPPLAPAGAAVYAFFVPLCHQIDSRSFHLFGAPLAVCGRCTAIYFGFTAGALLFPFLGGRLREARRGTMFLLLAAAPMVIDVALEALGVYGSSNIIRALTGGWFGVLLPLVIIPGAVEGIGQLLADTNSPSVQPEKGLTDA